MKRKICISAFLLFLLGGCAQSNRLPVVNNMHMARLHKDPKMSLVVISDDRKGQMWFTMKEGRKIESLTTIPETGLYHIWEMAISPDDHYLAVLSEGEGHPEVDIFDMNRLLSEGDGSEDEMISPILSINPYPGTLTILGWHDKAVLELGSDMPLDNRTRHMMMESPELPYSQLHNFLWDVSSDTITLKKKQ